jgi:hypothetical protein
MHRVLNVIANDNFFFVYARLLLLTQTCVNPMELGLGLEEVK